MNWSIKKKSNMIYHFLFWSVVWLLYVFFFSYNSDNIIYVITFSSVLIPITAIATYIMIYVLIPKYLNSKKYLWFGIYTFCTLLFTTFCTLLLLILSIGYLNHLKFEDLPPMSRNYAYLIILVYLVVAFVSFVCIWRRNTQTAIKNSELQQQLLTAKFKTNEQELSFLKNQIHPHFLFNTLNTIYGLALKKSVETPEVILKLSNLLDYILYQVNKPTVLLADEIIHLEQYIDLERIRFNDTLKVNFTKEITNKNILIAPMLLLPFVENAFKHGSIIDGFLSIIIHISVNDNELYFNIKNTYKQGDSIGGIGLNNIKERLAILYPKNYDLQIETKPQWFEINLRVSRLKQGVYA
jgi:two-component system, LytTR family, sensor kinase